MKTRRAVLAALSASLTSGCAGLFGRNPSEVPNFDVEIEIRNLQPRRIPSISTS